MDEEIIRIIAETEYRIKVSARGHWLTTNIFETYDRLFTFATIVGGFVVSLLAAIPFAFGHIYELYNEAFNLSIFVLGSSVSITSTLQAIFRWGERSQAHRNAAANYTNARRQLQILRLKSPISVEDVTELLLDLSRYGDSTPSVPEYIWKRAQIEIAREGDRRK